MPTTTTTLNALSGSGYAYGTTSSRAGASLSQGYVGIDGGYAYEAFYSWDTSGITGVVIGVQLQILFQNGVYGSMTGPGFEARVFNWGTLDAGDFRFPAELSALPLVGTFPFSSLVFGQYMNFTIDSGFASQIVRGSGAITRIVIAHESFRASGTVSPQGYLLGGQGANARLVITSTDDPPTARDISGQSTLSIVTADPYLVGLRAELPITTDYKARSRRVATGAWSPLPVAQPPVPRQQHAVAVVGGTYYMFGGVGSAYPATNSNLTDAVEAYDVTTDTWSVKATMPLPRGWIEATVVGTDVYLTGGYGPPMSNLQSWGYRGDFWRYDTVVNTWALLPDVPITLAGETGLVSDGVSKIFVLSFSGSSMAVYDIPSGTWSLATQPIVNTIWQAVLHTNGKIYASTAASELYELNPATQTFTAKGSTAPALNGTGYGYATALFNGEIWFAGGVKGTYDEVSSYNPTTNTWTTQDSLAEGRYGAGMALVGSRLLLSGGINARGTELSSIEAYGLAPPESAAVLDLEMDVIPAKVGTAVLRMSASVLPTAPAVLDPLRLNPGFMKIGNLPPRKLAARADGRSSVTARFPQVFELSGTANGVSSLVGRFPGPQELEAYVPEWGAFSRMTGILGPIWQKIAGSEVPLPQAGDPDVYVGGGDQSLGVDTIDEYAYVTTDDGRFFYLICGYWWGWEGGPSWDQWWSDRIYRWDALEQTWTELAHCPVGSEGVCAGEIDGKIYVLMGDTDDPPYGTDPEFLPGYTLQSMWVYDIDSDTWTRGTQPPFSQDYGACAVLDGKLYVVVAWDEVTNNWTNAFYVYDPVADTWTAKANVLVTTWGGDPPNVWAANGKIWLQGTFGSWPGVNQIHSYDPATNTWTDETPNFTGIPTTSGAWPYGRLYASAVLPVSSTVVRLVGGYVSVDTYEVNCTAKTFTKLDLSLPQTMGWFGGGIYGSTMYVVGTSEPSSVLTAPL